MSEPVEDKKTKTEKDISFDSNDIKGKTSTKKVKKDKEEKFEAKKQIINNSEFGYQCKKQPALKRHFLTKHDVHVCKECQGKFSSFISLPYRKMRRHIQTTSPFKQLNQKS